MWDLSEVYQRWNIQIDNEKAFVLFKNRVLAVLEQTLEALGKYTNKLSEINKKFLFTLGCPAPHPISSIAKFQGRDWEIYDCFEKTSSLKELIFTMEMFLKVLYGYQEKIGPKFLIDIVSGWRNAIELTPNINILIIDGSNGYQIIPAGAVLLDKAVVDEVLQWLDDYPLVKAPFEEALRIYLSKDERMYRNLLDNLRLALEEMFRALLNNDRSLENQKEELLRWMRERKASQPIINMFSQLVFSEFRIYQNEFVKHKNKFNPQEVEFLIYLVGTFMRFLIVLHRST